MFASQKQKIMHNSLKLDERLRYSFIPYRIETAFYLFIQKLAHRYISKVELE